MLRFLDRCRLLYLDLARSSWVATAGALAITTALWATGKLMGVESEQLWPWRAAAQLAGLWAVTLMAMALVAVARAQSMESVFGGLDRATRFHRVIGPTVVGLVGLHVILVAADVIRGRFSLVATFVPFAAPRTRTLDIIAFGLILVLTGLAYVRRLSHERWTALHRPIGVLFLVGAFNASVIEPGTSTSFEPLRMWIVILVLGGTLALVYRVLLFQRFGNRYHYRVDTVSARPDRTTDLVMRPVTRRMMYEPGTFVFIRVPGFGQLSRELHPFSISSTPVDRDLRLSIKRVGDFTNRIASLEPGQPIDVYGPFGGFTPHRFAQYRRLVFIGAGIGITPFLSMLAFESTNKDFRRIWLYYVVRDAEHAPYDEEIRSSYLQADSFIDYVLWPTAERGHLKAAQVVEDVQPLDNYAVMLCGRPEVVSDLASQFQQAGVPTERIITEELLFR